MAEREGWSIPWPTLAVLVAAGGALVWLAPPLGSSRPPAPPAQMLEQRGVYDVDARPWQDPFSAGHNRREATGKGGGGARTATATGAAAAPERLKRLQEQIRQRTADGGVLVLPVMVNAGPYSEYVESRLRARQAVLAGLGVNRFIPDDGEHIGYIEANVATGSGASSESLQIVPYEWCGRPAAMPAPATTAPASAPAPTWRWALVLWVQEEAFTVKPFDQLAGLLGTVLPAAPRTAAAGADRRVAVKVLGPRTSTGLQKMVDEVQLGALRRGTIERLRRVQVYAATPTAPDEALLPRVQPTSAKAHASVKALLESPWGGRGLKFHRTIHSDHEVMKELVEELERRNVRLRHPKREEAAEYGAGTAADPEPPGLDSVALVTEWDTVYGRNLPRSFVAAATEMQWSDLPEDERLWRQNYILRT